MNLLLDTHALTWFSEDDSMLSEPARKAIESTVFWSRRCFPKASPLSATRPCLTSTA